MEDCKLVEIEERGIGEYAARYRLAVEAGNHEVMVSLADAETGDVFYRSPPTVASIPPFLHAFSGLNYYTREKECRVIVRVSDAVRTLLKGKKLRVALKDVDGERTQAQAVKGEVGLVQIVRLPIAKLAPGGYPVEAALIDEKGEVLATANLKIEKRVPTPNEVKIDHQAKSFLVDGEPFFPYGWDAHVTNDAALREMAEAGFTHILTFNLRLGVEETVGLLDRAHRHGLKVIVNWETPCKLGDKGLMRRMYVSWGYGRNRRTREYGEKAGDLKLAQFETILARFEELVPRIRNHPALLAYMGLDEPSAVRQDIAASERIYEVVRKHDPYHPLYIPFSGEVTYVAGYDFVDTHRYLRAILTDTSSLSYLGQYVDRAAFQTRELRMPVHLTPQAGTIGARELTASECRAQVYVGLIHGASAMTYYAYSKQCLPVHGKSWEAMVELAQEVKKLTPILTAPTPQQEIVIPGGSPVHAVLKVRDGKVYLLAVSAGLNSQEVTFNAEFMGSTSTIREFLTNAEIKPTGSGFTETFAGQTSHVYEISPAASSGTGRLRLQVAAKKLEEKIVPEEFFAANRGARYVPGVKTICVWGKGNTLQSIAHDIADKELFAYDKAGRKATAGPEVDVIHVAYGGDLTLGDRNDPSKGETLEFVEVTPPRSYYFRDGLLCNGIVNICHSRIVGGGRPGIHPYYVGQVRLVDSELTGCTHLHMWGIDKDAGRLTRTVYGTMYRNVTYQKTLRELGLLTGDVPAAQ